MTDWNGPGSDEFVAFLKKIFSSSEDFLEIYKQLKQISDPKDENTRLIYKL